MIPGMQIPQSMAAIQHRTAAAMAGFQTRSTMPMGARPTPTPNQMLSNGSFRPQSNLQQQAATYTRTARNLPQNVIRIFLLSSKNESHCFFFCF
jgi:hypothetical protein